MPETSDTPVVRRPPAMPANSSALIALNAQQGIDDLICELAAKVGWVVYREAMDNAVETI